MLALKKSMMILSRPGVVGESGVSLNTPARPVSSTLAAVIGGVLLILPSNTAQQMSQRVQKLSIHVDSSSVFRIERIPSCVLLMLDFCAASEFGSLQKGVFNPRQQMTERKGAGRLTRFFWKLESLYLPHARRWILIASPFPS